MGIDDKLRSKNGTTVRYFLTDHLGSTEALADVTGAIVSSTSYDSFGNSTSNIATTYRYTGREYDVDTGLYYYRNRWYDPEIGRFTSKDQIGFAGGDINLYGYVGNNPLSFIDPFGFFQCFPSDPPSGWWDAIQGALDVAGLAPGVGIIADLTNAGISVARGNYADATLSMSAAIPLAGTVAGIAKIARKAKKALGKAFSKARAPNSAVIGRLDGLKPSNLRQGEHTLLDKLSGNLGSPKANWKRNSSVLREEMRRGIPIRDASARLKDSYVLPDGRTIRQTFLGMERNTLRNRGWTFDGEFWNPPIK